MFNRLILMAGLVLVTAGCTSGLKDRSAGAIGCRSSDIQLSEDGFGLNDFAGALVGSGGAKTWVAECHGQSYVCSASGVATNCTPMKGSK